MEDDDEFDLNKDPIVIEDEESIDDTSQKVPAPSILIEAKTEEEAEEEIPEQQEDQDLQFLNSVMKDDNRPLNFSKPKTSSFYYFETNSNSNIGKLKKPRPLVRTARPFNSKIKKNQKKSKKKKRNRKTI